MKSRAVHAIAVLAVILTLLGSVHSAAAQNLAREDPIEAGMRDIAQKLRCPVCQGQSVYDSNSGLAQQMRQVIRDKLRSGATEQEVTAFFQARYGDYVLMAPPRLGFHWIIWLAPLVLVIAGATLIVGRTRRNHAARPAGGQTGNDPDIGRMEL